MVKPILLKDLQSSLRLSFGDNKLNLHKGDITSIKAEAIVCPVNQVLDTRSGLARAIFVAAGQAVRRQQPIHPEPYGNVVVLPAGKLKSKYIFLTVLLGEKGLDKMKTSIQQAVDRTIRYAEFLRLKSVAFPLLGSPKHSPPYEFIAKEMMENVALYFRRRKTKVKVVLFSVYNDRAFEAFRKEARHIAEL